MGAPPRLLLRLALATASASAGRSSGQEQGRSSAIISCDDSGGGQAFPYQWTDNNVTAIGPGMAEDPFAAESAHTCAKAWCAAASGPLCSPQGCC